MATAVVSGEVALLLERHRSNTPDQVKAIMMAPAGVWTVLRRTPPAGSFGAGVSDAYLAVNSGRAARPITVTAADRRGQHRLYAAIYGQPLS